MAADEGTSPSAWNGSRHASNRPSMTARRTGSRLSFCATRSTRRWRFDYRPYCPIVRFAKNVVFRSLHSTPIRNPPRRSRRVDQWPLRGIARRRCRTTTRLQRQACRRGNCCARSSDLHQSEDAQFQRFPEVQTDLRTRAWRKAGCRLPAAGSRRGASLVLAGRAHIPARAAYPARERQYRHPCRDHRHLQPVVDLCQTRPIT